MTKFILFALALSPAFAFAETLYCVDANNQEYRFTINPRECKISNEADGSVRNLRCNKPNAALTVLPDTDYTSVVTLTVTANGKTTSQSAYGVTCFVQVD